MHALIVGFGHAGQAYLAACHSLGGFDRITVVDLDPNVVGTVPEGVEFNTSIPHQQADLVIIATPPHGHLDILRRVVGFAGRVVMEKPFALNAAEIAAIFRLAEQTEVFFSIHACYGEEIVLARNALAALPYVPGAQLSVVQLYCDPYWPDGPKNLGGPFWDSIFNALGVVNSLWDGITWNEIEVLADGVDFFDIACRGRWTFGPLTYRLTVDWARSMNLKVTEVSDAPRRNGVLINHNQQCVSFLSGQGLVSRPLEIGRLAAHYRAALATCLATSDLRPNTLMARRIAEQVLQIAERRPDSGATAP